MKQSLVILCILCLVACEELYNKGGSAPSVVLSSQSLILSPGQQAVLEVEPKDSYSPEAVFTWLSLSPPIATVDSQGQVTGISLGQTRVLANANKGYSASCLVTVVEDTSEINNQLTLNKTSMQLGVGDQEYLCIAYHQHANDVPVEWSSLAPSIASVDSRGLVTAVGQGTVLVMASAGRQRALCRVAVGPAAQARHRVYVAGAQNHMATLWQDGVATMLESAGGYSVAEGLCVWGGEVYTAGRVEGRAALWHNGQRGHFPASRFFQGAHAVAVSASGVYVAGVQDKPKELGNIYLTEFRPFATLWVDAQYVPLADTTRKSEINAVQVHAAGVYMAGWEENYEGTPVAAVWVNGASALLEPDSLQGQSVALGLCVDQGANVYAAGYAESCAMLWKNGVGTRLTGEDSQAVAHAVCVEEGVSYVVGSMQLAHRAAHGALAKRIAMLWKDGVPTPLSDGSQDAEAKSVQVLDNIVYIVGQDGNRATLWRNGVATRLGKDNNTAIANAVHVVRM